MKTKTMNDTKTSANYEINVNNNHITIQAHITNKNELRQFQHDLEELTEDLIYGSDE